MNPPLIVHPLKPKSIGWVQWPVMNPELIARCYAVERWYHRGNEVQVISSIEVVEGEGPEARPEFHISVSGIKYQAERPYRCSASRARWVLEQFDFLDYKEDNHVPGGKVRNFWRPIAESQNPVCSCNETEPKMREMQGDYIWRG